MFMFFLFISPRLKSPDLLDLFAFHLGIFDNQCFIISSEEIPFESRFLFSSCNYCGHSLSFLGAHCLFAVHKEKKYIQPFGTERMQSDRLWRFFVRFPPLSLPIYHCKGDIYNCNTLYIEGSCLFFSLCWDNDTEGCWLLLSLMTALSAWLWF